MMPNTNQPVTSKQADQKQHHDKHSRSQPMFPGTTVFVREYNGPHKWITWHDSTETGSSDF